MQAETRDVVARLVAGHEDGPAAKVREVEPVGGGCISETHLVTLADGRRYFVKSNRAALGAMFDCEVEGLAALREAGAIRVPAPVGVQLTADGRTCVLVMEAIERGARGRDYYFRFGRALAQLHRRTGAARCGWHADNFLGDARQPGGWSNDWVAFVRDHRIGFQLEWARRQRLGDAEFERLGERLLDRLAALLDGPDEPFVLLHGDLWSGNYLADRRGEPVVVDPAVWYGRREAEFGMVRLFGSCPPEFYEAYQAEWPMDDGWERRSEVFRLYHLLNHLNLFGRGYLAGCLTTLRSLAA